MFKVLWIVNSILSLLGFNQNTEETSNLQESEKTALVENVESYLGRSLSQSENIEILYIDDNFKDRIEYFKSHPAFSSFFHTEKEYKNAFDLMRKIRESKSFSKNPYTFWRLLDENGVNEVLFESYEPKLGPYSQKYSLVKISKKSGRYLLLKYDSNTVVSKHEQTRLLELFEKSYIIT